MSKLQGDELYQRIDERALARLPGEVPIVVEHRQDRSCRLEVERNSKGYRWVINVAADTPEDVLALADAIDAMVRQRFGA